VLSGVLAEAVRADLGASARLAPVGGTPVALVGCTGGPSAVVDGAVRGVEGARVLTLRALDPATGRVLAAHRATANALAEVMPTVDRLSAQLIRSLEARVRERAADDAPAPAPPCPPTGARVS
jgi:hypothetical protein